MGLKMKRLVVIDDEKCILSAIKTALRKLDIDIVYFDEPLLALKYLEKNQPDMIISDQRMPQMLGIEILTRIKLLYPNVVSVLLSAYNDFEDISEAFNKQIIQKYLSKPWDNKELLHLVQQVLVPRKNRSTEKSLDTETFHGMISNDQSMMETFNQIRKASTSNIPIFITGDTGTGKELAAKACHKEGVRASEDFIAVNCANFSDSLMESQLFGHVKGAFTGAIGNQQGLLAVASKGTLFMDEITCLPLPLQAKLLRVLQEKEFCSIGSHKLQKFGAQVITASSIALSEAVRRGQFREDLFYRLDVISIKLPRLFNRGNDTLFLAEYFLKKFSKIAQKPQFILTEKAKRLMKQYNWPGNIRQLENFVHSLVVLNNSTEITEEAVRKHLPDELQRIAPKTFVADISVNPIHDVQPLWVTERKVIQDAIKYFDGNIPRASAALEVSPSTIYRKINAWNKQFTQN